MLLKQNKYFVQQDTTHLVIVINAGRKIIKHSFRRDYIAVKFIKTTSDTFLRC